MAKQEVTSTLPILFSEVCEVVWEDDSAATAGRSLLGAFTQALVQGGVFDPTHVGSKDRLSNFLGYKVSPQILRVTTDSVKTSWGFIYAFVHQDQVYTWTFTGGFNAVYPNTEVILFDLSTNTGITNVEIKGLIVGRIDLANMNILSIDSTDYPSLSTLDLSGNPGLTSVDTSLMPNLSSIKIQSTGVTSLDVSPTLGLANIFIGNTAITSLDVTMLPLLGQIWASSANLSSIDVTQNPKLFKLHLSSNTSITTVDVTQNPELVVLSISSTQVGTIDLSQNIKLTDFTGASLNLTAPLDFSSNVLLSSVYVARTQGITTLDTSPLPELKSLNTWESSITSLDLTNNPKIETLSIGGGNFQGVLPSIDLSPLPILNFFSCSKAIFTSVDLTNNPLVTRIDAVECLNLTSINIIHTPLLNRLSVQQGGLGVAAVDEIYSILVAHGLSDGYLSIDAIKTTDTNYNILISRGWDITEYGT